MTQKQTAVMSLAIAFRNWQRDWDRYDKEKINKPLSFDQFITPFLEMEKEQIIDAYYQCGRDNFEHIKIINRSAIEYYNETYGSKGSDEHIVETNEMISSQTEISDEEIEKASSVHSEFGSAAVTGFRVGAKWYREQLKQQIL